MLVCLEMAAFAVFHLFSYPWKPYRVTRSSGAVYHGGLLGARALIDACNIWDVAKELGRSWKWVLTGGDQQVLNESVEDFARDKP